VQQWPGAFGSRSPMCLLVARAYVKAPTSDEHSMHSPARPVPTGVAGGGREDTASVSGQPSLFAPTLPVRTVTPSPAHAVGREVARAVDKDEIETVTHDEVVTRACRSTGDPTVETSRRRLGRRSD
jgi:hypothetical protein